MRYKLGCKVQLKLSVLMNTLLFLQFEAELVTCPQRTYDIDLSIEDMASSWRRVIDPLLNMAKKN